jgi:DNA invertase Pin-like site-specific DNA recombinase
MKTYDAVIRVSRRNNREGSGFMSPDEQRDAIQRYADANGVTIASEFDETDSVSGKTIEREGLQAALARALDGTTDGIIVAKVDRFARSVVGGLTAVGKLDAAEKDFVAVKDGVAPGNAATPAGRLLRGILFLFAQWQLESLTESWETTRQRHIGNGVSAHEPYGYRKNGERRLHIVEHEAAAVERMFVMRADGASWPGIADALNTDGVLVRERTNRDGETISAQGWTPGRVKSIVESRVYLGELASGEYRNGNAHEAIVDAELWRRANERRSSSGRRASGEFLLSGFVHCASCGVKMSGRTDRKKGREYRYYKCRTNLPFGKCPAPALVPAEHVEALVEAEFAERYFDLTQHPSADTSALTAAREERIEVEAQADAILTSPATANMARVRGADWLSALTNDWVARIEAAREAEHEAASDAVGVTFPTNLREQWADMPIAERRAFIADGFDLLAVGRRVGRDMPPVRLFDRDAAPAGLRAGRLDGFRPIDLG